jgi:methylenetetrahydrofolate reductase (NADPH)
VALRGDTPDLQQKYVPHPDGYPYARDLVEGLKKIAAFEMSVAAYPEKHPEALSAEADLENLKRKQEAGASRAITQFFFDTDAFARFCDRARNIGITMPIVPGILPIANFAKACEFAQKCGARIPAELATRFAGVDDAERLKAISIQTAIDQCNALKKYGVTHFHFYTLNRADLVRPICEAVR